MIMLGSSTYVEKVEFLIIFEILTRLGIVKRSFTCYMYYVPLLIEKLWFCDWIINNWLYGLVLESAVPGRWLVTSRTGWRSRRFGCGSRATGSAGSTPTTPPPSTWRTPLPTPSTPSYRTKFCKRTSTTMPTREATRLVVPFGRSVHSLNQKFRRAQKSFFQVFLHPSLTLSW